MHRRLAALGGAIVLSLSQFIGGLPIAFSLGVTAQAQEPPTRPGSTEYHRGVRADRANDVAAARSAFAAAADLGYPAAQARLAELLWNASDAEREPVRALAWSMIAVQNADDPDRIWIEDIHQNLFCRSSAYQRQDAAMLFVLLRRRFPYALSAAGPDQGMQLIRSCTTGERVPQLRPEPR